MQELNLVDLTGFDNKFDEFVERMQKMLSQMKPLPLVKDA